MMLNTLLKDLPGFIAYKYYNFVVAHYPDYVAVNPKFKLENIQGGFEKLFHNLFLYFLIPLIIYVLFKLYDRWHRRAKDVDLIEYIKNKKKYLTKEDTVFSFKSIIVFMSLFAIIVSNQSTVIMHGGYKTDFSGGMTLEDLAYAPGNQPITDEIVGAMNENVIPGVVETGEMIEDVVSDPALGLEMVEEVTGVNPQEIINELDN